MSYRTPATEKGTTDRIEADDGGYWVRLVTKQALRREGECMGNCLADGNSEHTAGEEDMVSDAIWSLRKACGTSYVTLRVDGYDSSWGVDQLRGPKNSDPSKWSVRQLRHLRAAFQAVGVELKVRDAIALVGDDGMTHRPDAAPAELKKAAEERQARERAEREAAMARHREEREADLARQREAWERTPGWLRPPQPPQAETMREWTVRNLSEAIAEHDPVPRVPEPNFHPLFGHQQRLVDRVELRTEESPTSTLIQRPSGRLVRMLDGRTVYLNSLVAPMSEMRAIGVAVRDGLVSRDQAWARLSLDCP